MLYIPFYKNLKDDNHCFQACLKMLLKYTFPKKSYSFKDLNKLTAHQPQQWTWNTAGLLFLAKREFRVVDIENFDYKQFAKFGEEYLKMIWTKEVFETQKKHSNFKKETLLAKKFIKQKTIKHIQRPTTLVEAVEYFNKGYFVMVTINPFVLEGNHEYGSHLVVLTNIDKKTVTFHDPGLPPCKDRIVTRKIFQKAMCSPYKEIASLIAVYHKNFKNKNK